MLDTIIYIPTILAYTFISLLVVILAFIVIYVSHKIYISIYDNLPISNSALASLFLEDSESKMSKEKISAVATAANSILAKHESSCAYRKSKTALRIIVTVEPCYLAYVVFGTERKSLSKSTTSTLTATNGSPKSTDGDSIHLMDSHHLLYQHHNLHHQSNHRHNKLVKYYDRLTAIPIEKIMTNSSKDNAVTPSRPSIRINSTPTRVSIISATALTTAARSSAVITATITLDDVINSVVQKDDSSQWYSRMSL